jgi:hypothetical protein
MRRAFLVAIVPPGLGEALQEAIEIRIAMRQNVDRFARGQVGEVMLYGATSRSGGGQGSTSAGSDVCRPPVFNPVTVGDDPQHERTDAIQSVDQPETLEPLDVCQGRGVFSVDLHEGLPPDPQTVESACRARCGMEFEWCREAATLGRAWIRAWVRGWVRKGRSRRDGAASRPGRPGGVRHDLPVGLEDPLTKFFPDAPPSWRTITVRLGHAPFPVTLPDARRRIR